MANVLRAALFSRVSTLEQGRFGYSIAAQKDALKEYCDEHHIKVVDHYSDEGVSGGLPYRKRPEMMRLLKDVEAGKIDIIFFTKLDRWFRSVKEYYLVQDILEKNNVTWKAIHEDYSTADANGRFSVNIFLAIAEQERSRTSERIKAVFEHKRKNRESFFGANSIPFGYAEQLDENGVRRLVKDPELEEALDMFFQIAVKYENVSKAARDVNLEYGLTKARHKWMELSKMEIYTGTYRGVENYCPAYISREDWLRLNNRNKIKANTKNNRVYLFTGLIECPMCHNNMRGTYCSQKRKSGETVEYYSYKCEYKTAHICDYKHTISQLNIEKFLLDNLEDLLKGEIANVEIEKKKKSPKRKTNVSALKEKLRRLEVIYMTGNKSDEEYITEAKQINDAIKKAESETRNAADDRDLTNIKEILSTDFKSIYNTLSLEDKRRFWRTLIKRIYIDGNRVERVEFN